MKQLLVLFGTYIGEIMEMDKEKYLSERLNKQIEWYNTQSQNNKNWFKSLRVIEIVSAAVIPFIAGYSESIPYSQVALGSLGVVIAVSAGLSTLNKYQENWLMYRTTCEALEHEKYLFLTDCNPYNTDNAFSIFVERIEGLLSKENLQWSHFINEKKQHKELK